jgi:hypothetical protein
MTTKKLRLHNAIERLTRRFILARRTPGRASQAYADRLKARIVCLTHAYLETL